MQITKKQRVVLGNSLAWCDSNFSPTDEEIKDFFGYNEKGRKLTTVGGLTLQTGWNAHYGNSFEAVFDYLGGKIKNPPISPPAAWIYLSLRGRGWDDGWTGWGGLLLDFITDTLVYKYSWEKSLPVFRKAYMLAALERGHISPEEMKRFGN